MQTETPSRVQLRATGERASRAGLGLAAAGQGQRAPAGLAGVAVPHWRFVKAVQGSSIERGETMLSEKKAAGWIDWRKFASFLAIRKGQDGRVV